MAKEVSVGNSSQKAISSVPVYKSLDFRNHLLWLSDHPILSEKWHIKHFGRAMTKHCSTFKDLRKTLMLFYSGMDILTDIDGSFEIKPFSHRKSM